MGQAAKGKLTGAHGEMTGALRGAWRKNRTTIGGLEAVRELLCKLLN